MVYCIPYFTADLGTNANPNVKQVWLFLDQNGSAALNIDVEGGDTIAAAEEFFENNELVSTDEPSYDASVDLVLSMVDLDATPDLTAFYTWSEVDPREHPSKEAWRMFLWMEEAGPDQPDSWGVNAYLKNIELAPTLNVYDVLSRICSPKERN
jgi:hypothetical protein